MMHHLEIIVGRRSDAPALIKHAIRFSRRLRQRNIYNYSFPPLIDDERSVCKASVGDRVINLFVDGSYTRSLLRTNKHPDGRAFIAQSNRMHAMNLTMAADDRRLGFLAYARSHINNAIEERRHYERTSSI